MPAINEVGELFDKGKYFLPQLIASAEAMKASIEYMEPILLQANTGDDMPTVVIATVEGDKQRLSRMGGQQRGNLPHSQRSAQ